MELEINKYILLMKSLEQATRDGEYLGAYEIAEYLFIKTQIPEFYNACVYYQYLGSFGGKDLRYLTYACGDAPLRELLTGTQYICKKEWTKALRAFKNVLNSNISDPEYYLYHLSITDNIIWLTTKRSKIVEAARNNLNLIQDCMKIKSPDLIVQYSDSILPYGAANQDTIKAINTKDKKSKIKSQSDNLPDNSASRFNCITAKTNIIDGLERATGEIVLSHAPENKGDLFEVKFLNCNTNQFTLLLFLIMEKEEGGHDWLSEIEKPEKSHLKPKFDKLLALCKVKDYKNKCKWYQPIEGRNWAVKAINTYFKEEGLSYYLIIQNKTFPDGTKPKWDYSYGLNIDKAEIKFIE